MLALETKFTQRQKENDKERVDGEKTEFDVQSKFVSQALKTVYQESGRNGISLINQFWHMVKKKYKNKTIKKQLWETERTASITPMVLLYIWPTEPRIQRST